MVSAVLEKELDHLDVEESKARNEIKFFITGKKIWLYVASLNRQSDS